MKIKEIITESTEELQIVNKLSWYITKAILPYFDIDKNFSKTLKLRDLKLPRTTNKLLSALIDKMRIRIIKEEFDATDSYTVAQFYMTEGGTIGIAVFINETLSSAKERNEDINEVVHSSIAHELQHAIDATKASDWLLNIAASSPNTVGEYLRLPHEVNARFQEAMVALSKKIPELKQNPSNLYDELTKIFKRTVLNVFEKDDPKYKRLVSRAYKFFKHEIENPKMVTVDQGFIKKAINFVLGRSNSVISEKLLDVPTKNTKSIAKKHGVPVSDILSQLKKGITVEQEHTTDKAVAKEIALDHLNEFPDYYERLEKVETNESAYGYIPSNNQKNDPRFKMALTKDVKPNTIKKNAKALGFSVTRAGIPPLLRK